MPALVQLALCYALCVQRGPRACEAFATITPDQLNFHETHAIDQASLGASGKNDSHGKLLGRLKCSHYDGEDGWPTGIHQQCNFNRGAPVRSHNSSTIAS